MAKSASRKQREKQARAGTGKKHVKKSDRSSSYEGFGGMKFPRSGGKTARDIGFV